MQKQNLDSLQVRKMKGLKRNKKSDETKKDGDGKRKKVENED